MKQELPVYERLQKYSLQATSPGREKERELATTSLEFEYLHRKSRCEMLIGGEDISHDVITLDTCFTMFAHIRARFRFALIGGNLTAQSTGNHKRIGGGIQIPETQLQALLSFPALPPERPGELAHRLEKYSQLSPRLTPLRPAPSCLSKRDIRLIENQIRE